MKKVSVPADVANVLRGASVQGNVIVLPPGQLERKLYQDVDKVLKAMGGKWDRKAGGHSFPLDPSEMLADALGTGKALNRKGTLQFFQTPEPLAERMAALARVTASDIVLEPSAGHGRLVNPAKKLGADVVAVEIDATNADVLSGIGGISVHQADFLEWGRYERGRFNVVLMNPPFSGGQDIDHITSAWSLLTPGGRLVAICSETAFGTNTKKAAAFRDWLASIGATVETLPAGTFREAGTGVGARLISAALAR